MPTNNFPGPRDHAQRVATTVDSTPDSAPAWELSVVVPTFNEAPNIAPLVERLEIALRNVNWQLVIVDDNSPDGTWSLVRALSRSDARISCVRRIGRRGLAGAVVEGAMACAAPFVAVIDADLQHDEQLLPEMLALLRRGSCDVVIGSRYLARRPIVVAGLSRRRRWGSRFANWLGRKALSVELTDPVSGFFMMKRDLIEKAAPRLSPTGFKVLFDILSSQDAVPRCVELPYAFAPRLHGSSKLDHGVMTHYLSLLASKLTRQVLSPRAVMFCLVGATGVAVHLAVLRMVLGLGFTSAQAVAAVTAMTSNYFINNMVTYRDRQKRGWAILTGYVQFCLLCGVGLVANVAVASFARHWVGAWWLAGLSGAAVGAAWNYVSTSLAVW